MLGTIVSTKTKCIKLIFIGKVTLIPVAFLIALSINSTPFDGQSLAHLKSGAFSLDISKNTVTLTKCQPECTNCWAMIRRLLAIKHVSHAPNFYSVHVELIFNFLLSLNAAIYVAQTVNSTTTCIYKMLRDTEAKISYCYLISWLIVGRSLLDDTRHVKSIRQPLGNG